MSESADAAEDRGASRVPRVAADLGMVVLLAGLVWGIVAGSGNLNGPPGFVDDFQLFALDRMMSEEGFAATLQHHTADRVERMGRQLPVYLTAKVVGVKVLGADMRLWSMAVAAIGTVAAWLLYLSGRAMRLSAVESVLFTLIAVLGEQSVIWWRRLHGEGIGLLFLALCLLFLALGARRTRAKPLCDLGAVLAVLMAMLSKESFLLTVPALCLLRLWLEREDDAPWGAPLKRNVFLFGALIAMAAGQLLYIGMVLQRTSFYYTGWKGFDAGNLIAIVVEFAGEYRLALWLAPVLFWVFLLTTARARGALDHGGIERAVVLAALGAAFVVPQLLLYMSSGFSGNDRINMARFQIPATLGIACVAAFSLRTARERIGETFGFTVERTLSQRVHRVLCMALAVPLIFQCTAAYTAAVDYRAWLDDLDRLLGGVAEHTAPDDVIALAYNQRTAYDTLRFGQLLEEYYQRPNLYFVPITWERDTDEFEVDWTEIDRYAVRAAERTVMNPAKMGDVRALVICNAAGYGTDAILQNLDWFERSMYSRIATGNGHAAYLKQATPIRQLQPVHRLQIELSSWRLSADGMMTIQGFAAASEPIEGIAVEVGQSRVGTVNGEGRLRRWFEAEFPADAETFWKPVRVTVRGGTGEMGSSTFEPRYELPEAFDPGIRERLLAPHRDLFFDLVYRSAGFQQDDGSVVFRGWAFSVDPITRIEAFAGEERFAAEYPIERRHVAHLYSKYLSVQCGYEVRVSRGSESLERPMTIQIWSSDSLVAAAEFEGPEQSGVRRFGRD